MIEEHVKGLTSMVLKGQGMEAFEKYYHDDVVMQENEDKPRIGKNISRKFEKEFMENVKKIHDAKVLSTATNGSTAMVEWFMDITFKDGTRRKVTEVAVQKWKNGKIVHEKFYYNTAKPN